MSNQSEEVYPTFEINSTALKNVEDVTLTINVSNENDAHGGMSIHEMDRYIKEEVLQETSHNEKQHQPQPKSNEVCLFHFFLKKIFFP